MGQRWHYEYARDGWVVLDENRIEVAWVRDTEHVREADVQLLTDAPRLRERLNSLGCKDAPTLRAELIADLTDWVRATWISSPAAKRHQRKATVLARMLGRDRYKLWDDLLAEARTIVAREVEG